MGIYTHHHNLYVFDIKENLMNGGQRYSPINILQVDQNFVSF